MASRGVNGAAKGSLNERFIKCEGCRVNVPKEDMLSLGKCTVCGRPYEVTVTADGKGIEVATVAFDASASAAPAVDGAAAPTEKKRAMKRWAVLTSKKGRTYYHNSETGEDRWDKPADLDADAVEDTFVPFKNDAVKKAVLREQAKLDATKMGVPMEVVTATQQRLQADEEASDPLSQMMNRGTATHESMSLSARSEEESSAPALRAHTKQEVAADPSAKQEEEAAKAQGSCVVM